MQLVLIKLGGGLITDKSRPFTTKPHIIERLAVEIAEIQQALPSVKLVIGNGAGSFGHYAVEQTNWKQDPNNPLSIAKIQRSVATLHDTVATALISHGVPTYSLPPSACFKRANKAYTITNPSMLLETLQAGLTPHTYGDIIVDHKIGPAIVSTEEALETFAHAAVSAGHSIRAVILATSVSGVLDADGETVPILRTSDSKRYIGAAAGFDVTGGMLQKVQRGFDMLRYTDHVAIVDGRVKGNLLKAVELEAVGTRLQAE